MSERPRLSRGGPALWGIGLLVVIASVTTCLPGLVSRFPQNGSVTAEMPTSHDPNDSTRRLLVRLRDLATHAKHSAGKTTITDNEIKELASLAQDGCH